jgi:ABC-2 type transport system ATP-binding protein
MYAEATLQDRSDTSRAAADPVIQVRGLTKRYGKVEVVRGIDLQVRPGEVFGFLGPNGAGKTTTVEIMEGFRDRSGGDVRVLGSDPESAGSEWRARVGIVPQESLPEPNLTARECLQLYAGYHRAPRDVDETIELVGLEDRAGALGSRLSGGERRRLDVALALIGDPEILFLDEPTTGFDPSARRAAWEVLDGLRSLGKTIFLTTHYMEEAERLADRIAVIAAGRIVAQGAPGSLGGRDRMSATIAFTLPGQLGPADLPSGLREIVEIGPGNLTTIRSERPLVHLEALVRWASSGGIDLPDLDVRRPTLEDVYLSLTGEDRKEDQ